MNWKECQQRTKKRVLKERNKKGIVSILKMIGVLKDGKREDKRMQCTIAIPMCVDCWGKSQ